MMQKNNLSWKIGGEAGFGIKSAGLMFAQIFMKAGYEIFDYTEYPSLIRGGHNTYQLIVDTRPVNSVSREVDVLVALNINTINQNADELSSGGLIIYDSDKFKMPAKYQEHSFGIPLSTIAKEAGNELMRNVAAIGATLALVGQKLDIAGRIVRENFQRKGGAVVANNIKALKAGYDYVLKNHPVNFICVLPTRPPKDNILIAANESLALGALAAGLNFYAGYPMTPSSTILQYLATVAQQVGIVVKHAEDEISVINMALGAAHVGARAMIATSGGGFALMVESLGLTGITETPLVIVNVQRPGPATGLPTWTEQGDLQFVLRAAQGDFPRIVLAPGDAQEAFELGAEAMNLAEIYQLPVIILSDKFIAEGITTNKRLTRKGIKINRGKLLTTSQLTNIKKYQRYKLTADGISPRTVPGMSQGLFIANSDEHDEYGFSSESGTNRVAQVDKRQRKLETLAKKIPRPKIYGNLKAKKLIVIWGSTKGVVLDAYNELPEKQQKKIKIMHLQYIWPLAKNFIQEALKKSKDVLLIENNSNAQLGQLIAQETGVLIKNKILKYDGRPFFREDIRRALHNF
ncbi:MAG: 2-oxoacid:acceptor oxidoreductase subunit alpha [Parcubacteria group bacterium]|nr:MAG: 2-oxoacid:acceptor oxidoreductase subunit alpha [Parcubacteria group bacterium]